MAGAMIAASLMMNRHHHHSNYGTITITFERSAEKKGPLRDTPVIPFPQDKLELFTGSLQIRTVKIQVSNEPLKKGIFRKLFYHSENSAIDKMNEWMEWIFDLKRKVIYQDLPDPTIPMNARTISIAMDGFEHGRACHDFSPSWGMAPGSYYTYQMFGKKRIQVTNYVEDGVSYVAGFCIYIKKPWISRDDYSSRIVDELLRSRKYPGRTQKKNCYL